ncbi:hypothetical protein OPU71_10260 [Niveibacterium sp. 24ML]|uniref:hypothetical protein n=1 Tax=Niveibacterium sp. 24ML TaxID=2985512 RepID=UPI0022715F29|nr:hypothetical protein [Niveibacterium sp. 24ML]MCX9156504.1 hypothetical protein [Niveibacterium sp. 24ML]
MTTEDDFDDSDERAAALVERMRIQHESDANNCARIERAVRAGIERACAQIAIQREEFEAKRAKKKRVSANESRANAIDLRAEEDARAENELLNSLSSRNRGNRIALELESESAKHEKQSVFSSLLEQLDAARDARVCVQVESEPAHSRPGGGAVGAECGTSCGSGTGPSAASDATDAAADDDEGDEGDDGGAVPIARIAR